MDPDFLKLLQTLRDKWGKPITILSGYRCAVHNAAIKGAKTSQHLTGRAVDIDTSKMTGHEKYQFLALAYLVGFKGIGVAKTFYHLDTRSAPTTLWLY